MSQIEEVKKILNSPDVWLTHSYMQDGEWDLDIDKAAYQICLVLEHPKYDISVSRLTVPSEPKPELICEGCGQVESKCRCELNDTYPLPKPDKKVLGKEETINLIRNTEKELFGIETPDKSRLLSDEELAKAVWGEWNIEHLRIAQAQDAKTASISKEEMIDWVNKTNAYWQDQLAIKDAECQARIERLFKEIEEGIKEAKEKQQEAIDDKENPSHYSNGRYWQGYEHALTFIGQALKKQEGISNEPDRYSHK